MNYTFALPSSFSPTAFLNTPRLAPQADDANWIVSTVLRKMAIKDVDNNGFAHLSSDIMRRILRKDTMTELIDALKHGSIETSPYERGVRCRGYRLSRRYLGEEVKFVQAGDPALLRRIEREKLRAKEDFGERSKTHLSLIGLQNNLGIDFDPACKLIQALPKYSKTCQDVLVKSIHRREYAFSVSKTGRVYNSITGLKRDLRRFITIDGEHVGCCDIKCCQPALLAALIRNYTTFEAKCLAAYWYSCVPVCVSVPVSLCVCAPDFYTFESLVCDGSFYSHLSELSGLSRDRVKHEFIVSVLAKKSGAYQTQVERVFCSEFPSVYRFIKDVNRQDHGTLIRILQRLESFFVIDTISRDLIGRVPFVPLHDAIYCGKRHLSCVDSAFSEAFERFGVKMSTKTEVCSEAA